MYYLKLNETHTKCAIIYSYMQIITIQIMNFFKITCVEKKMISQVCLLTEASIAYIALKGPTAVVHVHV
jgi:hypothetical protein